MKRILATLFLLLLLSSTGTASAAANEDRVRAMLERREQRLLVRKERWKAMLERREQRKIQRLSRRGLIQEKQEVRREPTVALPPPTLSPTPTSNKTDLLPNQTFTPVSPLPSYDATNHFLILGEDAPVIATITVTPDDEPVQIRAVKITLVSAADSIASFEVVDDLGYVLGSASLDLDESSAGNIFTLDLSPQNAYFIEKDDRIVLAVRPRTKTLDRGGTSAETLQVQSINLTAIGIWTSRPNLVDTSGPNFQKHQTALAEITAIEPSSRALGTFSVGASKKIGAFDFRAEGNSDSEADPALQTLVFSANAPSAVTLSNVYLRSNDVDTEHSCTVASSTITCSAIPASIGNLQSDRTLSLYADIAVTSHPDPFLQVELNQPGTPDSAGDITWSDGVSTFTWVEFDPPIAQSTSWE